MLELTGIIKRTERGRCFLIVYDNGIRKIYSLSRRLPVQSGGTVKIRGREYNRILDPEYVEIILHPYREKDPGMKKLTA